MQVPQVFVISPDKMQDRRLVTEKHLASFNLNPIIFSGLYGKDLGLLSTKDDKGNVYFKLTQNRIALALNHWYLWNHIAMLNIPSAIIFEDDILLPDDFRAFFDKQMTETPTDWDFIYMSILFPERIAQGKIGAKPVANGVYQFVQPLTWDGACDGLHAYMISREGARKLVTIPFTLNEPIDRWVSFNISPHLKTYIWHPSAIKQRSVSGEWPTTLAWEM